MKKITSQDPEHITNWITKAVFYQNELYVITFKGFWIVCHNFQGFVSCFICSVF